MGLMLMLHTAVMPLLNATIVDASTFNTNTDCHTLMS